MAPTGSCDDPRAYGQPKPLSGAVENAKTEYARSAPTSATLAVVSTPDFHSVLESMPEPQRTTILIVVDRVIRALPKNALVEECISYGIATIKVDGKSVAAFAANKNFCSYYPCSGGILAALARDVVGFSQTKSALHFPHDKPLSAALVAKLVKTRLREIAERGR